MCSRRSSEDSATSEGEDAWEGPCGRLLLATTAKVKRGRRRQARQLHLYSNVLLISSSKSVDAPFPRMTWGWDSAGHVGQSSTECCLLVPPPGLVGYSGYVLHVQGPSSAKKMYIHGGEGEGE